MGVREVGAGLLGAKSQERRSGLYALTSLEPHSFAVGREILQGILWTARLVPDANLKLETERSGSRSRLDSG